MNMDHWQNDNGNGKSFPVPLCPPLIPCWLACKWTRVYGNVNILHTLFLLLYLHSIWAYFLVFAHFVAECCFVSIYNKCKYGVYMYQIISDLPKTVADKKRALLFFNTSVQKSNRIHKCDLERILLDIKK